MELNAFPLELAAFIVAAGILGLVAGWRISKASNRRALRQMNMQSQQQQAEAVLQKQMEIDRLIDDMAVLESERDDLTDTNDLLEQTLRVQEREALLQRIASTELQLSAHHAAGTHADEPAQAVDWDADPGDDVVRFDALMESLDDSLQLDDSTAPTKSSTEQRASEIAGKALKATN